MTQKSLMEKSGSSQIYNKATGSQGFRSILKHCHDNQLGQQGQQLWLIASLAVQLPDQR